MTTETPTLQDLSNRDLELITVGFDAAIRALECGNADLEVVLVINPFRDELDRRKQTAGDDR